MKKVLFGFSALLICLLMSSCGPAAKMQSLADDIAKNGNDWTEVDQWIDVMESVANTMIEFADSDPSKEDYKEFKKATEDLMEAIGDIDNKKAKKAMNKAEEKIDKNKQLQKDLEKANKKINKLAKKYDKDDDDDDDDDD